MGALLNDGSFLVKDGPLNAQWTTVGGGFKAVTMAHDRIGALQNDGAYVVKEGPLNAQWTTVGGGFKAVTLAGDRIGALQNDGAYLVKEGPLNAQWTTVGGGFKAITMPGQAGAPSLPTTCPSGQTGTPPNCATPPATTCPSGQTGTPPNCATPAISQADTTPGKPIPGVQPPAAPQKGAVLLETPRLVLSKGRLAIAALPVTASVAGRCPKKATVTVSSRKNKTTRRVALSVANGACQITYVIKLAGKLRTARKVTVTTSGKGLKRSQSTVRAT